MKSNLHVPPVSPPYLPNGFVNNRSQTLTSFPFCSLLGNRDLTSQSFSTRPHRVSNALIPTVRYFLSLNTNSTNRSQTHFCFLHYVFLFG